MAKSIKNAIVCSLCPLHDTCKFELEGLPPCALVAQNSTKSNTTKDKIIQILGNMSAEDRDEIFGNWCRLCGAELPCYCAPCYDE